MSTKGSRFILAASLLGSLLLGAAPAMAQSHGGGGGGQGGEDGEGEDGAHRFAAETGAGVGRRLDEEVTLGQAGQPLLHDVTDEILASS